MKRLVSLFALVALGHVALFGQEVSEQTTSQEDPVIMTIDGKPVYQSEFEYIFKKNNRETEVTREALDEYIDLFVNFKLKVQAADDLGMDTIPKFMQELNGYRSQLAKPYLVDNERIEELVQEAYERTQWEIEASHILVSVDPEASPADSMAAYNRIMKMRDSIMGGADFAQIAMGKGGSDDPSAAKNGGNLGYFTAFKMVYPFETAAYATPVGEVSMPVRSRFGYHLIMVHDKRPARGEVNVAHIMIQSKATDNDTIKEKAEQKINEIYDLIGEKDFAELAKLYSQDQTSARNGGELGWFGAGKMVLEFDEASFALENIGDVSEPFLTSYGWHIVKLLDKRPIPTFEESEAVIKNKVSKDNRSQLTVKSFIEKLIEEYEVVEYKKNLKYVQQALDTTVFQGQWKAPENKNMAKELFTFDDSTVTVGDFARFMAAQQKKEVASDFGVLVDKKYQLFLGTTLMDYEDSMLEQKYPEFRMLMKEYRDGILLFELTEQKVWGKAMKDSAGLQEYYEANKTNFMWDERVVISIFKCIDEATATKAQKYLKKGQTDDYIVDKLNKDSQLNVYIENGTYEKGNHEIADMFDWTEGVSETKEVDGQFIFVRINEVKPPEPKALSEARGLVTAQYQKYLEEEWIRELRATYKVEVNEDVLYSIK